MIYLLILFLQFLLYSFIYFFIYLFLFIYLNICGLIELFIYQLFRKSSFSMCMFIDNLYLISIR